MSRHMEEKENKRAHEDKQRINMLVKRVKELEAKAGKGMVSTMELVCFGILSNFLKKMIWEKDKADKGCKNKWHMKNCLKS